MTILSLLLFFFLSFFFSKLEVIWKVHKATQRAFLWAEFHFYCNSVGGEFKKNLLTTLNKFLPLNITTREELCCNLQSINQIPKN